MSFRDIEKKNASVHNYGGHTKCRRYINIDTKPGNPSTFWVGASGKYYRKYKEAVYDTGENEVKPEEFAVKKSFFSQHKKTILCCVALLVAGLIIVWLFDKNKLVLNGKKW